MALPCIVLGLFLFRILISVASTILPRYSAYQTSKSTFFTVFPVLVRFILALLAIYVKPKYNKNIIEYKVLDLYLLGSIIFFLLLSSDQASRLTDYFSIFEIIYFPNAISTKKIQKLSVSVLFLLLFTKDLNAFQNQGKYYSKNPINYPYISIINKDSILKYRGDIKDLNKTFLFD